MRSSEWPALAMDQMYPLWLLKSLPNMAPCHFGIWIDARGPNNTLTSDEISGMAALIEAAHVIRRGQADSMVVGSLGSMLSLTRLVQRDRENFLPRLPRPATACKPFDTQRDGTVGGQGAAAIILERRSTAEARGARSWLVYWAGLVPSDDQNMLVKARLPLSCAASSKRSIEPPSPSMPSTTLMHRPRVRSASTPAKLKGSQPLSGRLRLPQSRLRWRLRRRDQSDRVIARPWPGFNIDRSPPPSTFEHRRRLSGECYPLSQPKAWEKPASSKPARQSMVNPPRPSSRWIINPITFEELPMPYQHRLHSISERWWGSLSTSWPLGRQSLPRKKRLAIAFSSIRSTKVGMESIVGHRPAPGRSPARVNRHS